MAELLDPIEIDLREGARHVEPTTSPAGTVATRDARLALSWLRAGMHDEVIRLDVPSSVHPVVTPVVTGLRWVALLLALIFAVPMAADDGSMRVVVGMAIATFLTIWRTFRPLRLDWSDVVERLLPVTDALLLGIAAGLTGGFDSPFIYCVIVAAIIAAFGWGWLIGLASIASATFAMLVVGALADGFNLTNRFNLVLLFALLALPAVAVFIKGLLADAAARERSRVGQLNALSEANQVLGVLNQITGALPASLDLNEAVESIRAQLVTAFGADTIALFTPDGVNQTWIRQLGVGTPVPHTLRESDLPRGLGKALARLETMRRDEPGGDALQNRSRSGLYTPLYNGSVVVGLLGIETEQPNRFGERERRVFEGLSQALGLTVDNARQFTRLRAIGGDTERVRIAENLHARLTQWLTYVGFELDRIGAHQSAAEPELRQLRTEVNGAIDDLKQNLHELQTGVSVSTDLPGVLSEVTAAFQARTGIITRWTDESSGRSLSTATENELVQIAQLALANIAKRSGATEVDVSWQLAGDKGTLQIVDNGQGIDSSSTEPDAAWRLIDMRDRADRVGAGLEVTNRAGRGTTVTVVAPASQIVLL